jgi:hypothetical protein
MTRGYWEVLRILPVFSLLALVGCDVHEMKAVRVAMQESRFPVSMSEYMVVDDKIVSRSDLKVVGELAVSVKCVKQDSTADVSSQINDQVRAAGGEAVIGLVALVGATGECQDLTLRGEIVKRAGQ